MSAIIADEFISITHDEGGIVSTNYWRSDWAKKGLLFLNYHAREFTLMDPPAFYPAVPEMRKGAKAFVVSVLSPEKWRTGTPVLEFLIEDGGNHPLALRMSSELFGVMPDESAVGHQLTASIWREKNGRPKRLLRRPAVYQIVPQLPWLRRTGAEELYKQWQRDRRQNI